MASVVFLKGVNVGGHKVFRPSVFVKELAHLDAVNVGAAGTLVIRKPISQAKLRDELLQRLPFQPDVMICTAREILDLAKEDPFQDEPIEDNVVRYVTVLAKRATSLQPLPICRPDGDDWLVKVIGISGRFVASLHRRMDRKLIYPNEVVEKHLGVSATTRNWNTITAICDILSGG
jgi:uncharacterized protein (DUF1697 family)